MNVELFYFLWVTPIIIANTTYHETFSLLVIYVFLMFLTVQMYAGLVNTGNSKVLGLKVHDYIIFESDF